MHTSITVVFIVTTTTTTTIIIPIPITALIIKIMGVGIIRPTQHQSVFRTVSRGIPFVAGMLSFGESR